MVFLYGDSTPFPLDDNFVETLGDLTEACVKLLVVDEDLERLRARGDAAREQGMRELGKLEQLAGTVVRALEPHMMGEPGGQIAVRVMQSSRAVLETARNETTVRRDATLRELEVVATEARAKIGRAIEAFFARRDLPDTVWGLRWKAGLGEAPPAAQVSGHTSCKLDILMDLAVPTSHRFAHAVRVGDLAKGSAIRLPEPGGWLRKTTRLVRQALDRYYVTEIERSPDRDALILRRSNKHPSPGLEIVLRAKGQKSPTARRLTEGQTLSDPTSLTGSDQAAVELLWKKIDAEVRGLDHKRARLLSASFSGKLVGELTSPATLVRELVATVAPLVREMQKRSAASGELQLKRDVGGGRREEVFVPRSELIKKIAVLPASRRAYFEPFGLDGAVPETIIEMSVDDALTMLSADDMVEDTRVDVQAKPIPAPPKLAAAPIPPNAAKAKSASN